MKKYIYIITIILSLNIKAGEEKFSEDKPHIDRVTSICLIGKEVVSASFDGTIKKTKANTSQFVGKHKDWVQKIICEESNIISASNDGVISIWNGARKVNSVQAHEWWVTDIVLDGNKLVTVSLDETVKIWSYPALKLLHSYKIHGSNKHYSVVVNKDKVFVGSTNGSMFVLDLHGLKILRAIWIDYRGKSVISSIDKSDKYVFVGTSNGLVAKINMSEPYKVRKIKISDFPIKAISHKNGFLYAGDSNGYLRKIKITNLKKHQVIYQFSESINSIEISNNHIYIGYDKGYIRSFRINED